MAPFAVPFSRELQGSSGTSSPLFSTLDVFFGRSRYASALGREMCSIRASYPEAWRAFLAALSEPAVRDLIAQRQNPALRALWHDVRAAYVGPDGFLERHPMKVYGYLELAFKVGRNGYWYEPNVVSAADARARSDGGHGRPLSGVRTHYA